MPPLHLPISRRNFILHIMGLIVLLLLPFLLPDKQITKELNLTFHLVLELLSILFSWMIFAIGWFSYTRGKEKNVIVFSSLFLSIGMLDLGHMLSYEGMPAFLSINDPYQSNLFWIAARLVGAASFLSITMIARKPSNRTYRWNRYAALVAGLAFTTITYWVILGSESWLPITFKEIQGFTTFKISAECLIIGLYGISAITALIRHIGNIHYRTFLFFWALAICMMGEVTMSMNQALTDVQLIFGSLCKLTAYGFIFRAIFWDQVHLPYKLLENSERETRNIRDRLYTTLDSIYDAIIITDESGRISYMNPTAIRFFQCSDEGAIFQPIEDVFVINHQVHPVYSCILFKRSSGILLGEVIRASSGSKSAAIPVDYSIAPIIEDSGAVVGTVLVFRDVSDRKEFERSQEQLISILEATSDFVATSTVAGEASYFNKTAREFLGVSGINGVYKDNIERIYASGAQSAVLKEGMQIAALNGLWSGETAWIGASGEEVPVHQVIVAHRDENNEVLYFSMIARSLHDIKMVENKDRLASKVFENITEGIMVTDSKQVIQYVNPAFTAITGYREQDIIGATPRLLSSGRHDAEFYNKMWTVIRNKGRWQGEIWNKRKDEEVFLESITISEVKETGDSPPIYIALFKDVTIQKELEARIQHQAHHDTVTGLPNRLLLNERIEQTIKSAVQNHNTVGILFLDLDRFKRVNDTFGHSVGDMLLKSVAQRLKNCLRSRDTIARLGGDEFIVLIPDLSSPRESTRVAEKIILALTSPFFIEMHELYITVSIGISHYPTDGDSGELLIRYADQALYKAKEKGKDNYQVYVREQEKQSVALHSFSLETSLRRAIHNEELTVHYQPQYNAVKGELIGVEALARWNHPEWGNIPPSQFIPLAEESGLITLLDQWVLRRACEQAKSWFDQGFAPMRVSINLSMLQFRQPNLLHFISRVLWETSLPPKYLNLELTESTVMDNPETAMHILNQLRSMGIRISLDDFGVGYSSLNYIKKLPIDTIKIDQSFVRDILEDIDDQAIVQTIITLSHALHLNVIAEGVENEGQLEYLRMHKCEEIQGFLYSKPLPEEEVVKLFCRMA
ncbi:bifunctional diguanylate cyclase/phosphodiesterase [Paenibacillus agricola]|uniref:EAL domain-containing protein n=1 Tax=Paenibacillus agricola TaxID=2716264 RepID=A0ABX0J603_9BACL|nr:EAL domain-containing protein [Paenibacillus agricola]NHN29516.1 EAL domain-containing protein [Paenibacillus agricola]